MSFAFGTEDMVLTTIEEGIDEQVWSSFAGGDEEDNFLEDFVQVSKMRTADLEAAAEKGIEELSGLLGKLKIGSATRDEKKRMLSLNAKLDGLKKDIEESKQAVEKTELQMLKSEATKKVTAVRAAIKEKEVASVVKAVGAAEGVDLAFVVDCTGSMEELIASVKRNIKEIVRRVRATNASLNLRLAVVAYRDLGDGAKRFEVMDFSTSVEHFESFVGGLAAIGGDDGPEDLAGAIQKTNGLSWSQKARVVFIVADAPCHGSEYHSMDDDNYPSGTPGINIATELQRLQANFAGGTMSLNFGKIMPDTDKMIDRFGNYGIHFDVVDLNDTSKVAASVTKSVRTSIFKTITVSLGDISINSAGFAPIPDVAALLKKGGKKALSLKDYRILPVIPSADEWMTCPAVPVKVFRNRGIQSIQDLQAPIGIGLLKFILPGPRPTDGTRQKTMFMRRAAEPFAEGEIRLAYHGQLSRNKDTLDNAASAMVMKSFKYIGKGIHARKQYLKQMEVSTIAHFLANEYNESNYRPSHCARIRILQVCVVEEEDDTNEKSGNRRFCAEELLPEKCTFSKYSNNTGHWNDDCLEESLLRFTDYTYQVTNKYLMVTDLQGIKNGDTFILTDPVILCKDLLRFGHTNLGEKFMKKCIDSTRAYMTENGWD